jgi:hypothetical protein
MAATNFIRNPRFLELGFDWYTLVFIAGPLLFLITHSDKPIGKMEIRYC